MKKCLTAIFFTFAIWGISSVLAADRTSQKNTSTGETPPTTICQISASALNAIDSATAIAEKIKSPAEAPQLIYQAKKAAKSPECDSIKASGDSGSRLINNQGVISKS